MKNTIIFKSDLEKRIEIAEIELNNERINYNLQTFNTKLKINEKSLEIENKEKNILKKAYTKDETINELQEIKWDLESSINFLNSHLVYNNNIIAKLKGKKKKSNNSNSSIEGINESINSIKKEIKTSSNETKKVKQQELNELEKEKKDIIETEVKNNIEEYDNKISESEELISQKEEELKLLKESTDDNDKSQISSISEEIKIEKEKKDELVKLKKEEYKKLPKEVLQQDKQVYENELSEIKTDLETENKKTEEEKDENLINQLNNDKSILEEKIKIINDIINPTSQNSKNQKEKAGSFKKIIIGLGMVSALTVTGYVILNLNYKNTAAAAA